MYTNTITYAWGGGDVTVCLPNSYFRLCKEFTTFSATQTHLYVTLEHKTRLKSHGYICSNSQKYIVQVKIIDFYFMPKIIGILSKVMFHEDIFYISYLKYIKT